MVRGLSEVVLAQHPAHHARPYMSGLPAIHLATLAALCDIFECGPGDLVEPVRETATRRKDTDSRAALAKLRPRRARVLPEAQR